MAEQPQGKGERRTSLGADQFHINPNGDLVIKDAEVTRAIQQAQQQAQPSPGNPQLRIVVDVYVIAG